MPELFSREPCSTYACTLLVGEHEREDEAGVVEHFDSTTRVHWAVEVDEPLSAPWSGPDAEDLPITAEEHRMHTYQAPTAENLNALCAQLRTTLTGPGFHAGNEDSSRLLARHEDVIAALSPQLSEFAQTTGLPASGTSLLVDMVSAALTDDVIVFQTNGGDLALAGTPDDLMARVTVGVESFFLALDRPRAAARGEV